MNFIQNIEQKAKKEKEYIRNLGKNWLNSKEQKELDSFMGGRLTNKEKSMLERYYFLKDKPKKYTGYLTIKNGKAIITTWTGDKIAEGNIKSIWRNNFGDKRHSYSVKGINGIKYYGFGIGSGMYCHLTAYKN